MEVKSILRKKVPTALSPSDLLHMQTHLKFNVHRDISIDHIVKALLSTIGQIKREFSTTNKIREHNN